MPYTEGKRVQFVLLLQGSEQRQDETGFVVAAKSGTLRLQIAEIGQAMLGNCYQAKP